MCVELLKSAPSSLSTAGDIDSADLMALKQFKQFEESQRVNAGLKSAADREQLASFLAASSKQHLIIIAADSAEALCAPMWGNADSTIKNTCPLDSCLLLFELLFSEQWFLLSLRELLGSLTDTSTQFLRMTIEFSRSVNSHCLDLLCECVCVIRVYLVVPGAHVQLECRRAETWLWRGWRSRAICPCSAQKRW